MTQVVELPLWLFVVILLFATVTALSHFLLPSVRWFFRRRLEKAVERLNTRLTRPIEPFKLARRHDMIQRLIYDPQVSQAIVDHARKEGVPENVAFEQARRYAREIVPSFSAFAYFSFGIRLARFLANALYEVRTGAHNAALIKSIPADATVIFVMNHRSNMDYMLVTYLAGEASALSYAVGEWARVWPLSRLIKSMGAYFIRRKSRGALYRKVLARYVQMATEGGVTQAIFPEGGLSLNGKLMPPKMGLLGYVTEADLENRDVVFVPVAINYDRVLEDRVLIAADRAGTRRFRARISVILVFILRKTWLRIRGKFLRFGEAAVVFGEPVLLRDYGPKPDVDVLAQDLMRRIADEMPLLFVPLMARIMLLAQGPLDQASLEDAMRRLIARTKVSDSIDHADFSASVAKAREHLVQRSFITRVGDGYVATVDERPALTYYANSVAHFFDG
ncbi:1-acyl-sn-glycerol-3-phosphate acyltransferase [Sulfitobacter sp.]|uniref:1-acyl-sn-glycerol-3-phosphate acyltransferase n=1 Tax=Sulfitobacter sp. TaxID=1903071 RepID=UPI003F6CF63E